MIDARSAAIPSPSQIPSLCDSYKGIGADGIIFLQLSYSAHLKMRIFNSDGSEADMCGNGIRCLHAFARELHFPANLTIETRAGIYNTSEISLRPHLICLTTSAPKIEVQKYTIEGIECHFLNTGTPHLVCQVTDIEKVNVQELGKILRHHPTFQPIGTNVNFVKIDKQDKLSIRTYEKGVERETSACGTGAIASAYVYALNEGGLNATRTIETKTRSGGSLITEFVCELGRVVSLRQTGPVRKVFEGNVTLQ